MLGAHHFRLLHSPSLPSLVASPRRRRATASLHQQVKRGPSVRHLRLDDSPMISATEKSSNISKAPGLHTTKNPRCNHVSSTHLQVESKCQLRPYSVDYQSITNMQPQAPSGSSVDQQISIYGAQRTCRVVLHVLKVNSQYPSRA